jgi:drug/metabolite transporter (DMT)-like permease
VSAAQAEARAVDGEADWAGYAAFAVTSLIWGSTFLVIAFSDAIFAPLWGATLRLAIASVFLIAIALITRPRLPRGGALRDVALFGALQFGGNLALLYLGEQRVPSGITAVVFATGPLQTALYARLLGTERLDRVKLIAAVTALAGVAIIFAGQLGVGVPLLALVAVFGAAVSAAIATVLLHRAGRWSPWAINAIGAPIGAAICLVASVVLAEPHPLPNGLEQWWPVLYLAILGSLGAFVLYSWLVGRWSGTTASFIGVIVPVIALVLGAIFRAERPPIVSFLGAALVIAAVVVALTRSRAAAH